MDVYIQTLLSGLNFTGLLCAEAVRRQRGKGAAIKEYILYLFWKQGHCRQSVVMCLGKYR